ncbi:CXXX repeat peptide modification system protein [Anaeroselena agilis]|uniref:CXXX repeat peptide modification system protein n=1 Tax=Anaeroselena agilis TaxID=3063788 RepID=A0ABU3P052_9FIRM|nr:CXXX repeat peptide modification system protein [Selenomonadales bacterium 4137-cl]
MNDTRRKIGAVTPAERDEIRALFERKNALRELFRSLAGMPEEELAGSAVYERLVADMGRTATRFQQWWDEKSAQYGWENISGYSWEIDFASGDIYIRREG